MKNFNTKRKSSHKYTNLTTWCGFTGRWGTKGRRGGFEKSLVSKPIFDVKRTATNRKYI